jgi:Homeodomain-like domain
VSTVRKLTESDKQEILQLYRETGETTSTLAERFDVSNSTISRLLKSTLAEDEYEYLVSLKRAARTPEGKAQVSYVQKLGFVPAPPEAEEAAPVVSFVDEWKDVKPQKVVKTPVKAVNKEEKPSPVVRRVKRRSLDEENALREQPEQLELLERKPKEVVSLPIPATEKVRLNSIPHPVPLREQSATIAEFFGDDLLGEGDDDDLDDDLDDLDVEDDDDDDEEEWEAPRPLITRSRSDDSLINVLPLSDASLPRTCYLVIDRSAELITRPLRDFGDLGEIPNPEIQQRTLPVFDNHRVAKRFSTKRDRVIKVPDSRMLQKARHHLEAKGITRLLIDGQVYSFSPV